MTEQFSTPSRQATAKVSSDTNIPQPGIRPLLVRIGLVLLLIFFADFWIDIVINVFDLCFDAIATLFDLFLELQGYLSSELIAKQFDLPIRTAELVTFYSLLPFELLFVGYITLRITRWAKRAPKTLKNWWLKEKELVVISWQQLQWFWKLGIVGTLLLGSQFLF